MSEPRGVNAIFGVGAKYKQQLKTPQWRKFSADVRQAKGRSCNCCRRSDIETHVHHIYYDPNKLPWEYSHADVVLLCWKCHQDLHAGLNDFRKHVFRCLNPNTLRVINGALAVGLTCHDPLEFVYAVAEMASSPRSVKLFAAAWKPKPTPPYVR